MKMKAEEPTQLARTGDGGDQMEHAVRATGVGNHGQVRGTDGMQQLAEVEGGAYAHVL